MEPEVYREWKERLSQAEKVMIGLGAEWQLAEDGRPIEQRRLMDPAQEELRRAYRALYELVADKDYYLVTTVTDGAVYDTDFSSERIVAPCGNIHWLQCSKGCRKDIWEEGELPDGKCPHCGAPLTGNTVQAQPYIEEGYLPRWKAYKTWQTSTLNHSLLLVELGVGFKTPTVIRWPFEKITYLNQKACLYRINQTFSQIPPEIRQRAYHQQADSKKWILEQKEAE